MIVIVVICAIVFLSVISTFDDVAKEKIIDVFFGSILLIGVILIIIGVIQLLV